MNHLSRLLPASNVLIDFTASSKKRVFEQAGLIFENNQAIARAKVFDSLFARERLGSTGLGQGVAIPHGRIKGLKEAVAAFVRVAEPIPFDAPDGQPVGLIIFLLVPEQATRRTWTSCRSWRKFYRQVLPRDPADGRRPERRPLGTDDLGAGPAGGLTASPSRAACPCQ